MTEEQFENRMSFIVEQQAQFATDILALREAQSQTEGMLRKLIEVNLDLANHLQEIGERLGGRINGLDEKLREMAGFQAHSDRRLDALIDAVHQSQEIDGRLGGRINGLDEKLREMAGFQAHSDRRLDALIDAVHQSQEIDERLGKRITELDERQGKRMSEWDDRVKEIADFQAHSDRRLDALIDVVNQYIQRRNGSGKEDGGTAS